MFKRISILCTLVLTLGFGAAVVAPVHPVDAASPAVKQGDNYNYVWGLQNRLQQLGLYKGAVDGHFGLSTRKAVIAFQKRNGLTADGIVGKKTLKLLRNQTFTSHQIQMLAQVVYAEARGESFKGQVAVAAVVLNRLHSSKFPDTLKGVIFQPYAFTCVLNGTYKNHPNKESYKAVYAAISGWDPSHGSLYYFNPATATSGWIWSRPETVQIGHHIFAK